MNILMLQNPGDSWLARLQENGYRLTDSRRAVVQAIASSERILTPLEVFDQARRQCASLGLVTVYRTLSRLEELGLVERVHGPGDCHAYIPRLPGHQHLLICQHCGRAEYFGGDRLGPLMDKVAAESGYRVSQHWLQLSGLCGQCQAEAGGEGT